MDDEAHSKKKNGSTSILFKKSTIQRENKVVSVTMLPTVQLYHLS